jgi:hypothetical protein
VAQALGEQDLGEFFSASEGVHLRSLWLVGELIASVNRLRTGEVLAPLGFVADLVRSLPRTRFDDLVWYDPLALCAEAACYAKLFIRSGGETNPVTEGMFG